MTPDALHHELEKGKYYPIYLFYGSEHFLIEQTLKKIKGKIVDPKSFGFNAPTYYCPENSPEEIINAARTFPVMSNRKIVVVRDVDTLPSKNLEKFIPYLQDPIPATCLIFVAKTADMRKKFYQVLKKTGKIVLFDPIKENRLALWIGKELEKLSKTIDRQALSFLMENTGGGLAYFHNEIQKVALYIGDRSQIELDDLKLTLVDSAARSIFNLVFHLGMKDCENGLKVLDHMLLRGEPPLLILTMITRQFRLILRTKEILRQGGSLREIKEKLNLPGFAVKQLIDEAKRFSFAELIRFHQLFVNTDLALKSSGLDKRLILEGLIFDLCKQDPELERSPSAIKS